MTHELGGLPADIARKVLQHALLQAVESAKGSASIRIGKWGANFGKQWIGALHDGFRIAYPDEQAISVLSRARPASGPTSKWRRREYLYDLVVAEAECLKAPFHATAVVPVITKCLWQVESEVVLSASGVAEDLSKLVLGSAVSNLFIAAIPVANSRLDDWVDFIETTAANVQNHFFLALIPTYSAHKSRHNVWMNGDASIYFYTREGGKLIKDDKMISLQA